MFSGYLFNGYRRLSKQFIFWSIPVAVGMSHLLFYPLALHGLTHDGVLGGHDRLQHLRVGEED